MDLGSRLGGCKNTERSVHRIELRIRISAAARMPGVKIVELAGKSTSVPLGSENQRR